MNVLTRVLIIVGALCLFSIAGPVRASPNLDPTVAFPPGPADDTTTSLGSFRIVVDPAFRPLMAGYPGYDGVSRLQSPHLFDAQTRIGRSAPHLHGDATDTGGTAVGTAGTIIADSTFSLVPPGFQGPANTREVHTEVRSLNLTSSASNSELCNLPLTARVRAGVAAPDRPISPGEVESKNQGDDFPAESFFNVFVEVDLPAFVGFPGGTLFNRDALLVTNTDLNAFPPKVVYIHENSNAVPVLFKADDPGGAWQAGDRFGWLVLAGHGVEFDCNNPTDVQEFDRAVQQVPEMKVVTRTIEIDRFPSTRALVGIKLADGTLVNAILNGPATVEVDLESLDDRDTNEREEVLTELVRMELTGSGMTLRAGRDFGLPASNGRIEENENKQAGRLDLPGPDAPFCTPPTPDDCVGAQATSFFDVFFEVEVAGFTGKLHNKEPLRVEAIIDQKPPKARYHHVLTQPIELYNANNQPTGVFLVTAEHNTTPELDHFKCYNVAEGQPADVTVFLRDQFGAADAQVRDPFVFCNPVAKQHSGQLTPIKDPDAHLKFYHIQTAHDPQPRAVAVRNQFGDKQTLRVFEPLYLAVPTQKQPHQPPQGLDHFKCYRVTGKAIERTVALRDQFHEEPQVRVLEPQLLCNPVLKRHSGVQTPIRNPDDHLVCYRIPEEQFTRSVQTRNQFGEENLVLTTPRLLCVPSGKTKEVDEFITTRALVGIRLPNGTLMNAILSGPATVEVDLASLADASDEAASPGAPDTPNGLEEVRTELVSMELTGSGLTLRAGSAFGLPASNGQIEETANKQSGRLDLPGPDEPFCTPPVPADCAGTQANSFFDVFFEIDVPGVGKLHNNQPLRVQAVIDRKPPKTRYLHVITQPIELFNENNQPTGVHLVTAEHNTGRIEVDHFEKSSALVGIRLQNGSLVNVVLSGPATVEVELDSLKDARSAGAPGANGLEEVDTELMQMELTGNTALGPLKLRAGRGHGLPASKGQIEETENKQNGRLDLPGPDAPFCTPPIPADCVGTQANSFFDVFFEVEVPGLGTLFNKDALRIHAVIDKKPPVARYIHVITQPIELYNEDGQPTGIFLVTAEHNTTPVEVDRFPRTVAAMAIETPLGREVVRLRGPTVVYVFIDDSTGAAEDTDGDGREQVKTEMVQLELRGHSSLGPVVVRLSPTKRSTGEIKEMTNNTPGKLDIPPFTATGAADSFFDIFFEVAVGNRVLHNDTPVRMQSTILHKPPTPVDVYQNPFTTPIDLLDENGAPTGIKLVKEIHIPNPPIRIKPFLRTRAIIKLRPPQGDVETIMLGGTATTNLLLDDSCSAVDSDDNGLDDAPTELTQLELRGTSPSLGQIVLRARQVISATGVIEEMTNTTTGKLDVPPCAPQGRASSFFDVFFEIEMATARGRTVTQGDTWHTATPVQLQATLSSAEPLEGAVYMGVISAPLDLLDENDVPTGYALTDEVQIANVEIFLPLIHPIGPQ